MFEIIQSVLSQEGNKLNVSQACELAGVSRSGHPIPDENGITATKKSIEMVKILIVKDQVIFLLSGGGSALFENF